MTERIAIVGAAGRFPGGANSLEALWCKLKAREDMVGEWPAGRWDHGFFHPDKERPGRVYTQAGGFLDQIDQFDADFFGFSPREAAQMDPQQRLLLELSWEALEDGGLLPKSIAGSSAGVFIGVSSNDYGSLQQDNTSTINAYTNSGGALSITANRLSYFYDLKGPSLAIDTACSSALVAVHEACQSLRAGESCLALAGGVNALIKPSPFVGFCKASMLSPTGRCKSFDASSDGYVRAEGGVILVLKPLEDAERDRDRILGLIVASGVNSDGRTRGLSLPSEAAQEALLRRVYAHAGLAPEKVFYVEAHGTGTLVGDPIECGAIGRAIGLGRPAGEPCYIGSIKSNIGHLEPASGGAGIAKVLLALKHREIPANLHFNTPNPNINFEELNLRVVADPLPLPARAEPLLIGVNSFGFGGTNAHVVIQEYHGAGGDGRSAVFENLNGAARTDAEEMPRRPLLLSARSEAALRALAGSYANFVRQPQAPALGIISSAAANRRSRHPHRLAVLATTSDEMARRLDRFAAGELSAGSAMARSTHEDQQLAFVFCGNGPQWWGMGRELLAQSALFRATVAKADEYFAALAGWSMLAEMTAPQEATRISRTEVAQPLLFALQIGITALLDEAGVRPVAATGHSVGEIAAAYAAGALSLKDAVRIVFERSQAQAPTAGQGKMAAIGIGADQLRPFMEGLDGRVEIAAVNSPSAVTLSGEPRALEQLGERLALEKIFFKMLPLDYAFHSYVMDPVRGQLLERLQQLAPQPAVIPFVSTVTGRALGGSELDAEYWWRNLRQPVQFASAIETLLGQGIGLFLEIGPHPVLRDYIGQVIAAADQPAQVLTTLHRPSANSTEPDSEAIATAISNCYAHGAEAGLRGWAEPVELPAYPWERQRFWTGGEVGIPDIGNGRTGPREHPILGHRAPGMDPSWEGVLDHKLLTYLSDHVVQGAMVFPAAGYMEMAIAAARLAFGDGPCELEDFDIRKALIIPNDKPMSVQCVLNQEDHFLRISSRPEGSDSEWTLHAAGKLGRVTVAAPSPVALGQVRARLTERIDKATHYNSAAARGLAYGPAFQGVESLWTGDDEVIAEMTIPAGIAIEGYHLHPALLDACLQSLIGLVSHDPDSAGAYLPVGLKRFRLYADSRDCRICRVRVDSRQSRSIVASFQLLADDGAVLAEISRMRFQAINFQRPADVSTFSYEWQMARQHSTDRSAGASTPKPSTIAAATRPAVSRLTKQMGRREFYAETVLQFDGLAAAYAIQALRALNPELSTFSTGSLIEHGGVLPEHRRLLERLCRICEEDGFLLPTEQNDWKFAGDRAGANPEDLWRILMRERPDYIAELVLIHRCGMNLTAIMRGEADPIKLMFPEKGSATLEHLYDAAPGLRVYNMIAAAAITEIVARWPSRRPIRVLEIGGGTGGLTSSLLPLFPPSQTIYTFTDVSEAFVGRAKGRFANYRFVESTTFDFEKDLAEQQIQPGAFDLILGADVVHVAGDLREALGRIRSLLAPGGLLMLIEKHPERASDVVFGTLKGWWNFKDLDLRPDSALLSPDAWKGVLEQVGFDNAEILSDAEALPRFGPERMTQHSVLLAHNNGDDAEPSANDVTVDEARRGWLILSDEDGPSAQLSSTLHSSLQALGHEVVRVYVNGAYSRGGPSSFNVGINDSRDFLTVIETLSAEQREFDEIVHLSGLAPAEPRSTDELVEAQDRRCLSTLHLVQALMRSTRPKAPRLTLVTGGAHSGPSADHKPAPSQAPLWGLGRVVMNEHPELNCRLIDLHMAPALPEASSHLLAELRTMDREDEVLLTATGRYVHRLRPITNAQLAMSAGARSGPATDGSASEFRLGLESHGNLDSFKLSKLERIEPGPGQVEIRVRAAGLNFRDVMFAMGLLPDEALENGFSGPTLGLECAGEVERVGAGVNQFAPGDRVIAFGSSCFSSHIVTSAQAVARIRDGLSFEAAATIPTTFFTAYYALKHLAGLRSGESVLIHGAAGGVGLAAIQIARHLGAEIYGSAGTDEKRELLKAIGVDHVLDSRSVAFVDEIEALTGGRGVDVVLNSLAGDAMWKSISVLRPLGRFIELGKRDYVANTRIGLRPFRNNLSYFGVDADQLLLHAPELTKTLLNEILELFTLGNFHPLPHRVFTMDRSSEAFRLMQQSRHIGKIVLTTEVSEHALPRSKDFPIRSDVTYLVTGGLTGLGLATAQWLVKKGARHLALIGRRGANTPEAGDGIAVMEAAGASVRSFAADITDEDAFGAVMKVIKHEMPALRGVIHAAMVLDDGIILQLNRERLHRALGPKMVGAWLLHQLTLDQPLDFFVLYSSGTTLFGNPGQANYVAGCMFLESLAEYRYALGLPSLAIGWGAIAEVGYIARNAAVANALVSRTGLRPIAPKQAMAALEDLLVAGNPRMAAVSVDWDRLCKGLGLVDSPKFAPVLSGDNTDEKHAVSGDFLETLKTLPAAERLPAMIQRVSQVAGRVMGTAAAQIDVTRSLDQLGIDSLMTVEIGSSLEADLGFKIPTMALMEGSISAVAQKLLAMIEDLNGGPAPSRGNPATVSAVAPESAAQNGHHRSPTRLSPSRTASIKLLTIPYIGGGSRAFASWAAQLGDDVELIALPWIGGEEKPNRSLDMNEMIDSFGRELLPRLDRPYALYGHSLGALIAFELVRWLRQAGADQIQHLFVGAYAAPRLESPLARILESWPEDVMDRISSDSIWAEQLRFLLPSGILNDPRRLRGALPAVKAGLGMLARYRYAPQPLLTCPITAFAGSEDRIFSVDSQRLWAHETTGPFELFVLPGDHLFVRDQTGPITSKIRQELSRKAAPRHELMEAAK